MILIVLGLRDSGDFQDHSGDTWRFPCNATACTTKGRSSVSNSSWSLGTNTLGAVRAIWVSCYGKGTERDDGGPNCCDLGKVGLPCLKRDTFKRPATTAQRRTLPVDL